jgi:tryptophan-rich sensory protein
VIWSLIQNPVFVLAAPSGAAFLFLIPYALWGRGSR